MRVKSTPRATSAVVARYSAFLLLIEERKVARSAPPVPMSPAMNPEIPPPRKRLAAEDFTLKKYDVG